MAKAEKQDKQVKSQLVRAFTIIPIIGAFVIVAVIVFGVFKFIPLNKVVVDILGVLGIICLGFVFATPWVQRLQTKQFSKTICIVFISIIGGCILLWLICWILTMHALIKGVEYSPTLFNLTKISFIITIQLVIGSMIAYIILKYKKTMIPFQVVTYLSYLYVDFYVTYILACIDIKNGISFPGHEIIFSRLMLAILVIAVLYVMISNLVLKNQARRKIEKITETPDEHLDKLSEETSEDKLLRLKNMKDTGLITDEEYESKKAEIMKDF